VPEKTTIRRRLPGPPRRLEQTGEAGPAGHSGATLQSGASDPTPTVSPSDKSLSGPATSNATPPAMTAAVPA
jgi:hypothetical protein